MFTLLQIMIDSGEVSEMADVVGLIGIGMIMMMTEEGITDVTVPIGVLIS